MHFINEQEIRSLISMKDIIDTIEEYYINDGEKNSFVPERLFINDDDNSALLMPSFYENYYGAKLIGIAPGNAAIGEATLRGIFLLNEKEDNEETTCRHGLPERLPLCGLVRSVDWV